MGRGIPLIRVVSKGKVIMGTALTGAVVIGGLGALATVGHETPVAAHGPVTPTVARVDLRPAPEASRVDLPQRDTTPFSLLGVTWDAARARLDGRVEVRTRSVATGQWSAWRDLQVDGDDAPDPREAEASGVHGGTAPLWVGPSDGVQVRIDGKPSTRLPAGLGLALVDPGHGGPASPNMAPVAFAQSTTPTDTETTATATTDPSSTATTTDSPTATDSPTVTDTASATSSDPVPTTTTTTAPAPSTSTTATSTSSATSTTTAPSPQPASTAPMPPIGTRASWGAAESLRKAPPDYATKVKVLFVHHTDTANDYTCGDGSKAVIRSIYAYHVKSLGWNDIGYNFLVDKCGTLFEGRYGGMDRPVVGAHTYGFNTDSAGVAVLGTYTTTRVNNAVLSGVARLGAWKLGIARISPNGTSDVTYRGATTNDRRFVNGQTYTFKAISGHRNGFATACPGDALYAQLPTVRTWAAGPPTGLTITGISGAAKVGTTWYTKGAVTASWSVTSPTALVAKSELLVDGAVVATSSAGASAFKAILAAGSHSVRVRATHVTGSSATSSAVTVVGDVTAPTFPSRPRMGLRGGTVSTSTAPVTVWWKAADNTVLKQVASTAPTARAFATTTTSWATTARPGYSTTFALKATDVVGNAATASTVAAPVIAQESLASRYGTWTRRSSSSYLGGYSLSTSARNASLTWTFTGRSVAWVVSRASGSGQAAVYVDGTKVATVDLRSSTVAYRQAIWTRTWAASGKHTVKVVNLATSGRPTITTDGIAYLK